MARRIEIYVIRIHYGSPCHKGIETLEYGSKERATRALNAARNIKKADPCIKKVTMRKERVTQPLRSNPLTRFPTPF